MIAEGASGRSRRRGARRPRTDRPPARGAPPAPLPRSGARRAPAPARGERGGERGGAAAERDDEAEVEDAHAVVRQVEPHPEGARQLVAQRQRREVEEPRQQRHAHRGAGGEADARPHHPVPQPVSRRLLGRRRAEREQRARDGERGGDRRRREAAERGEVAAAERLRGARRRRSRRRRRRAAPPPPRRRRAARGAAAARPPASRAASRGAPARRRRAAARATTPPRASSARRAHSASATASASASSRAAACGRAAASRRAARGGAPRVSARASAATNRPHGRASSVSSRAQRASASCVAAVADWNASMSVSAGSHSSVVGRSASDWRPRARTTWSSAGNSSKEAPSLSMALVSVRRAANCGAARSELRAGGSAWPSPPGAVAARESYPHPTSLHPLSSGTRARLRRR